MIRCTMDFRVTKVALRDDGTEEVYLATLPGGTMELQINNTGFLGRFKPGQTFVIEMRQTGPERGNLLPMPSSKEVA
jgi:hypothetical protein